MIVIGWFGWGSALSHQRCNFSLDGGDKSKRTDVRVVPWCTGLGLPGKEVFSRLGWLFSLLGLKLQCVLTSVFSCCVPFFQTRTGGEFHPDDITHGVSQTLDLVITPTECLYLPLLFPWVTEV